MFKGGIGAGFKLDYAAIPLLSGPRLASLGAALGVQYSWEAFSGLSIIGAASAGGYMASIQDAEIGSILDGLTDYGSAADARLGVAFELNQSLALVADIRFKAMFRLHYALGLSAGATWKPGVSTPSRTPAQPVATGSGDGLDAKGVVIGGFDLEPVFPVFYSYYNEHPFGTLTVKNNERGPVSDLRVSYSMKQYMDLPAVLTEGKTLAAGQSESLSIQGLFNDAILGVTEGTLVATEFIVSYTLAGKPVSKTYSAPVRILDRNSMSWFDDRCAAAYVTAKDPVILNFAKNVTGSVAGRESFTIDRGLQAAVAIHTALELYGINYLVDPKSSYAALSDAKDAIDFLQFPRQTIEYRSGDCDDLSILYAALLEASGVETAFITTPGHIYLAIALDMPESDVRRVFPTNGDFIHQGGKVWLPFEITERRGGFLRAWQLGASQWREHSAKGQAALYPVRDAWNTFAPVAMPGGSATVTAPRGTEFDTRYDETIKTILSRELAPQESRLQEEIQKTQGSAKARNSLGVLYASYGLYDLAEEQFKAILKDRAYLPALINAGNVSLIKRDHQQALTYFSEARAIQDGHPGAIVGMILANYELGNSQNVALLYKEISRIAPDAAARVAYTVGTSASEGRASATTDTREVLSWTE